jgi:polyphosphate glucokinase
MQQETVLGIDVGATGIKGSIIDVNTGQLAQERHRIKTPQPATPDAIAEVIAQIATHFNWQGPIGCGFPSVVTRGVAQTAANIDKAWIGVNIEQLFSKKTGCPVKVINDADAAGIAEMYFGGADGQQGLTIVITLGTGLGSAVFVDGVLVPNTELGHIFMNELVAEKYVSDGVRKKEGWDWEKYGKRLNKYLNHIERVFSPDLIVLGGGGSKEYKEFKDFLKLRTRIIPAQMLNDAGIVGAAYYAYYKANNMTLKGVIE